MRSYFPFFYVITLMVALAPASLHADLGEQPLDVCDCPEIEQLSSDMRGILEEAYTNQGEIPPFSFDEFTVTLAIQLNAQTSIDCLETLIERPHARVASQTPGADGEETENPMPNHLILDAQGRLAPNVMLTNYREATLDGRYVVFQAQVNGEPRTFLLQRNEAGEVVVTSYRPRLNVEALDFSSPPPQERPTREGLQVTTNAMVTTNPQNGEELTQGRYEVQRALETENGNVLQFRGAIEGNEQGGPSDTLTVSAGTTLSYDVDGRNESGVGANGTDLELRASVLERRQMTTGDLTQRDLSYGATLFGADNTALSLDVTEQLHQDPTYNLQFGNAGRDGAAIEAVIGGLEIERPQAGASAQGPSPSSGEGKGPPQGQEDAAGPGPEQEAGPLNPNLFHMGARGELGESPTEFEFSLANTDGEGSRYLAFDRNLTADSYNFRAGAGNEHERLNFNLSEDPFSTTGAFSYQWQDPENPDPQRQVIQTVGAAFRENPYDGSVTTLSYDRETLETDTHQLEGDVTLSESERRVLSAQAATDGTLTLSYDSSLTRDYSMPIPLRDEDDRPIEGTRPYQFGTYERSHGGALEVLENGYTVSGTFSEQYGSMPDRHTGEMTQYEGYEIGISVGEMNGETQTAAELTLRDSEGVLGSPCETLGLGHYTNSASGNNPARPIDIHDFNSYGQLTEGTNCGLYVQRGREGDHYLAAIRDVRVRDFDPTDGQRELVRVQQIGVAQRPNGNTYGNVGIGWQMNFSSGAFLRR